MSATDLDEARVQTPGARSTAVSFSPDRVELVQTSIQPGCTKELALLTLPHTSISSLCSVLMCIKLHCTEQI